MNKEEALQRFGLNPKEISVYLKLLKRGISTANELSKETHILRQTVYEIIDKLIEKGLVSYVIKAGVKYFEASDPSKFLDILNEKHKIIQSVMSELEIMRKLTKTKPKIEVYEGIEGLKSIYNDIIKTSPKELLEYGNSTHFIKLMKVYFIENYVKRRAENNIKLRLITERDERIIKLYGTDKKLLRETRYLPEIKDIITAGYVYGDKTVMISLVEEPIGVIIENKEMTETQKKFFEILWKQTKP